MPDSRRLETSSIGFRDGWNGTHGQEAIEVLSGMRGVLKCKKMNLKINYRESFRPFAPSVMFEKEHRGFDLDKPSPYMLLIANVKEKIRK